MNKPACLGLSVLEISKIVMYKFWYDYLKPKYREKAKLCYMDTDHLIIYIKTNTFTQTFQKLLKQDLTLQTMNYTDHYLNEKNKKVIGLMKDEFGRKIMTKTAKKHRVI